MGGGTEGAELVWFRCSGSGRPRSGSATGSGPSRTCHTPSIIVPLSVPAAIRFRTARPVIPNRRAASEAPTNPGSARSSGSHSGADCSGFAESRMPSPSTVVYVHHFSVAQNEGDRKGYTPHAMMQCRDHAEWSIPNNEYLGEAGDRRSRALTPSPDREVRAAAGRAGVVQDKGPLTRVMNRRAVCGAVRSPMATV